MGGSGGALGELWEAQGQLWEALAELWEALGELWEALYIEKPNALFGPRPTFAQRLLSFEGVC